MKKVKKLNWNVYNDSFDSYFATKKEAFAHIGKQIATKPQYFWVITHKDKEVGAYYPADPGKPTQ